MEEIFSILGKNCSSTYQRYTEHLIDRTINKLPRLDIPSTQERKGFESCKREGSIKRQFHQNSNYFSMEALTPEEPGAM